MSIGDFTVHALSRLAMGLSIAVSGLVVSAIGAACYADDSAIIAKGGTGTPEKADLTFGLLQTADHAPFVIAVKDGLFKQEGVNVEMRVVSPTVAVTSLISGDLDVTSVSWIQYVTAGSRGISLKVLSEADRGSPGYTNFVVKTDSSLQKPADLIGKKVGVVAANGICDFLLDGYLMKQGVDYKAIGYATVPIPDLVPTLLRDGVDAICLPEPLLTTSRERGGIRPIYDLFTGDYAEWPITAYTVSEAFATKNPNTVGALQRGLAKALELIHENPQRARDAIPTYTPIPPDVAQRIVLPFYPQKSDPSVAQRVTDLLARLNVLAPN